MAADPGDGEPIVELADELIQQRRVMPGCEGVIAADLSLGAQGEPGLLILIRHQGSWSGFMIEVPAFPALLSAQALSSLRASRTVALERRPARHEDLVDLTGHDVGAAQLDRADAPAVGLGELPDRITRERHRQPFRPGRPGHQPSPRPRLSRPGIFHGAAPGQARLVIEFRLGEGIYEPVVAARLTVDGAEYSRELEEILEVVLGDLARRIEPLRWECCLTCLLSDYSPLGVDLVGMRCHRDARSRYLAVRSKSDYWGVPVTEEVPEFYHCDSYEPRIPGTGHRG